MKTISIALLLVIGTILGSLPDRARAQDNEPIGGDWEIVASTFEAKKTAAFAAQFNVPVAKDGEATLSYRVRVKY
jgi:hypothetical protein